MTRLSPGADMYFAVGAECALSDSAEGGTASLGLAKMFGCAATFARLPRSDYLKF